MYQISHTRISEMEKTPVKKFLIAMVSCGLFAASASFAQTAPAKPQPTSPAAATPYYTIDDSTIGDLLDNPATKAILAKHLAEVVNGEGIERARGMTLPAIKPFSQGKITDEQLGAIDKELASVPAPK
jgi:hypothetical protein